MAHVSAATPTPLYTACAGIRPSNLRDAAPFEEVQRQVADLLKGRIVVGHAIANDLEVGRAALGMLCMLGRAARRTGWRLGWGLGECYVEAVAAHSRRSAWHSTTPALQPAQPLPLPQALLLSHKRKDVRDTSRYPPLMREQARTGRLKPRALRHLAAEQLGLTIQEGEHSPVDDAVRALCCCCA